MDVSKAITKDSHKQMVQFFGSQPWAHHLVLETRSLILGNSKRGAELSTERNVYS